MRFGPWQPLADLAQIAPAVPGVLQVRGDALHVFPRGKSAMILYAASPPDETLQTFVQTLGAEALARARTLGALYVRFGESANPAGDLTRLLDQFQERFGGLPPANS
ncbi:MAG TPA: hypothetical protein VGG33_27620 [Polyangia bacterium]